MAGTVEEEEEEEEELGSLLSTFDQIYQDYKGGIEEMQVLKSNLKSETSKREALELAVNQLKQENARLSKMYLESLNYLAEQLEGRTKWQSLEEELKKRSNEHLKKEDEQRKTMEVLKQAYTSKIGELESKVRGLLFEKVTSEATMNHLRQDLAAHKAHMHMLAKKLDQVRVEVDSNYNSDMQDLRDCIMVEQEEKNELNRKLQDLEKELLITRTKLVGHQQDAASNQLVEVLKQKIMKLRKENEVLRRKLSHPTEG